MTPRQIRNMREAILGETQEVFARRFGVSRSAVAMWEREAGKPPSGPALVLLDQLAEQCQELSSHPQ